jgi:hypothetical protein
MRLAIDTVCSYNVPRSGALVVVPRVHKIHDFRPIIAPKGTSSDVGLSVRNLTSAQDGT